jgi:hypothetical protein
VLTRSVLAAATKCGSSPVLRTETDGSTVGAATASSRDATSMTSAGVR